MKTSMATILQDSQLLLHHANFGSNSAGNGAFRSLSLLKTHSCRVFHTFCQVPGASRLAASRRAFLSMKAVSDNGDSLGSPAVLPSGEWPENFSILNFEDLSKHYESVIFKEQAQPSTFLADIMSRTIYTARPDQCLEEIDNHFLQISGLPVVNDKLECIGVLSKKDKTKAANGLSSKVHEVMSSPAITLTADKTVSDAAILMLKHKIHRIPVVNNSRQVVGMVTRTDIFSALEGKTS